MGTVAPPSTSLRMAVAVLCDTPGEEGRPELMFHSIGDPSVETPAAARSFSSILSLGSG
jgi:hypothetical protein